MQDNYGYKVCYRKHGKSKLKIFIVTNAYELAAFHIRWYETHSQPNENLLDVIWTIVPIKPMPNINVYGEMYLYK